VHDLTGPAAGLALFAFMTASRQNNIQVRAPEPGDMSYIVHEIQSISQLPGHGIV
jgi:hypothetical protein